MPRCPNGTRKNPRTAACEPYTKASASKKRCPAGTRKSRKTGKCETYEKKPPRSSSKNAKDAKKMEEEMARLRSEYRTLEQRYEDVDDEDEDEQMRILKRKNEVRKRLVELHNLLN
jgi:hypothetical protein